MARIKKNDQVIVIAGKDKGKTGRVLKVIPETKQRTRVGFRLEEGERPNGRKRTIRVRYAKKSGKDV